MLLSGSKLLSSANVAAMNTAGTHYVTPAAAASVAPLSTAAQDPATPVEYTADHDQGRNAEQRDS
ncbi:hypothetical protein ADL25_24440 [Streptomyces sp. NRRL F-5122]|uniref:hypothetical protein n=1 Tax=Streptomyces sp. NRRL F-5122 TaxID=1609098 RepID=UPI000740E9E8|nr:hypothetical protein [Streptomyces sp. NRRL F-5122]KUJ38374.1 hypothetical protein ADL25_24440 [Streptomyces sp. NRRL F-5122]